MEWNELHKDKFKISNVKVVDVDEKSEEDINYDYTCVDNIDKCVCTITLDDAKLKKLYVEECNELLFDVTIGKKSYPIRIKYLQIHKRKFYDGVTLYVYKNNNVLCKKNNHKLEAKRGLVMDKNGMPHYISVYYCEECDKYIMNYESFKISRAKYNGTILGAFEMVDGTGTFKGGVLILADESPLMLCGYNVKSTGDNVLTSKERALILSTIIRSKVLTKEKVCDYLDYFIKLSINNPSRKVAVEKWSNDLEFVNNYNINNQPIVAIKAIKAWGK